MNIGCLVTTMDSKGKSIIMKPILDGLNQTLKQPVLSETVCLTLLPTGKMELEMPPIPSRQ